MRTQTSENKSRYYIPLTIIITLLLALIPAVMAYGSLTEKVNNQKEDIYQKTERIISLEDRIIVLEKIAAGTEVSLNVIKEDIGDIKSDIKEIAHAMNNP